MITKQELQSSWKINFSGTIPSARKRNERITYICEFNVTFFDLRLKFSWKAWKNMV